MNYRTPSRFAKKSILIFQIVTSARGSSDKGVVEEMPYPTRCAGQRIERLHPLRWLFACLIALSIFGCEPPAAPSQEAPKIPEQKLVSQSIPGKLGDVEVRIEGKPSVGVPELIDLSTGHSALDSGSEILLFDIVFQNKGSEDITYRPPHKKDHSKGNPVPQLWGIKNAVLEEKGEKKLIHRIQYSKFNPVGQQTSDVKVAPGTSIKDRYAFSADELDQFQRFILILPGSVAGGPAEQILAFDIAKGYTALENAIAPLNKGIKKGDVLIKITKAIEGPVDLVPSDSVSGQPAYDSPTQQAKNHLLQVHFKLSNTGQEKLRYNPAHTNPAGITLEAVSLENGEENLTALDFVIIKTPNIVAKGQLSDRKELDGGDHLKDIFLFEKPPKDTDRVRLSISAGLFDINSPGLMVFEFKTQKYVPPASPSPEGEVPTAP